VRWNQWRVYFTDINTTGIGPQRLVGFSGSGNVSMAEYPKIYNIEMDPHEDLNVAGLFMWVAGPVFEVVEKYKATLKKNPNPPVSNITKF
jgi:arylsulfatase